MAVYLAAIVCIIGLILWRVAIGPATPGGSPNKPWAADVGRIMFAFGLLVFLLRFTAAALNF